MTSVVRAVYIKAICLHFAVDSDDIAALCREKSAELVHTGVSGLSEADVLGHLSRKELLLHCRRTIRGVEPTTRRLQQVIDCFDSDQGTDRVCHCWTMTA